MREFPLLLAHDCRRVIGKVMIADDQAPVTSDFEITFGWREAGAQIELLEFSIVSPAPAPKPPAQKATA
jgi:hypothetical protein